MNAKKLILLLKLSDDNLKSKIDFEKEKEDLKILIKKRYVMESEGYTLTLKAKKKLNFFLEEVKW